jgi:O-succinylbenzoic acid--CoA ligase
MDDIFINEKGYSFLELQDGKFETSTSNEKHTCEFIQAWLNGKEEFTVFTSGSTGNPKPIVISRQQMILSAQKTGDFLSLKTGNTTLICLSTEHIAGKMMLVRTLELGLKATVVDPCSNPYLNTQKAFDFTALVPLQTQAILAHQDTSKLFFKTKNIIIGGAPLNSTLEHMLINTSNNIHQTYGMTETVSHVALKNISKGEKYYQALPDVFFTLDSRNCLEINAPMAHPQVLTTNDIVELISSTSFIWKGRADFVINTGGIKVQTEELELQISVLFNSINLDTDFFVFSKRDDKLGEKICLCSTNDQVDLLTVLQKNLPKYRCPKSIYLLKELKYNTSGKIDRKASIEEIKKRKHNSY